MSTNPGTMTAEGNSASAGRGGTPPPQATMVPPDVSTQPGRWTPSVRTTAPALTIWLICPTRHLLRLSLRRFDLQCLRDLHQPARLIGVVAAGDREVQGKLLQRKDFQQRREILRNAGRKHDTARKPG